MADTISAAYNLSLKVTDTPDFSLDLGSGGTLTHQITGGAGTLTASSAVPATKAWSDQVQLSSGTLTLDLTALSRGSVLSAVDFSGLKVQIIKLKAPTTNTADITVDVGAANGYELFLGASSQLDLGPGDSVLFKRTDNLADVAAGDKDIDLSSSDVDALLDIILVAG